MKKYLMILLLAMNSVSYGQLTPVFGPETGEYAILLDQLEKDILGDPLTYKRKLGERERQVFVPWIRDHIHVMKAMKYLKKDMTSFIAFYLENQTESGMYFDYYYNFKTKGINDRVNIFEKKYWKIFPEDSIQMHRLPIEADLEYLLVEGAYAVWQSTGDVEFIKKWLPALVKGLTYSMTDPLRWSAKFQLVKRGYTLDTWDFMQLPESRAEYTRKGGNVQKGIFDIDSKTPMGIMHGDNSGMYAACTQLSKLFEVTGNTKEAEYWLQQASLFRKRTNELCWNGKFYAHFVEDDPMPAYLHIDQKNTLSLSNPYDINRGLPEEAMAQSIIKTYQQLKESNMANSFSEWYGIYPAVEPHFADYKPGSYMNGGVNTIVGGELAKAAFQHGYEAYGVDILQRMMELIKKHNGQLPVAYTPEGKVDEGIPDNWGQAAVYSAAIEGLAGIVDKSTQFKSVEISPRWLAAGKHRATVSVPYGPTQQTIGYNYLHDTKSKIISISIKGDIENSTVRFLLPSGRSSGKVKLNSKTVASRVEKLNQSTYVVIEQLTGKDLELYLSY